jgi:carboxypeptidase C (cathepsin A)
MSLLATDGSRIAKALAALLLLEMWALPVRAQENPEEPSPARLRTHQLEVPVDTAVVTEHEVTIRGEQVPYEAEAGMQPVYDEEGMPRATLFYTYYRRTDAEDAGRRPLLISFNGGPGSGSLWMHLGYTSPKHLLISDEGYPVQPYGVEPNHQSVLDVADIVYVNPVNTGFSRALGEADPEQFYGVNEDVSYLADWISRFVSQKGRWTSPKFLIGESYGTTRVAGLAGAMQSRHWMFFNGVILVSPTGLGLEPPGPSARSEILKLPYYAATAWYHDQLPPGLQQQDLDALLSKVERFTMEEYLPALSYGGSLGDDRKQRIAEQVARYAGVSEEFVLSHNLAVPAEAYWKELLRDEGNYTIGRLDSRYKGVDRTTAGGEPDYPAELAAWNHAFAPAINHYVRGELGFETNLEYYLFGPTSPWDREDNDTGEALRDAMAANPYLDVMVQSGLYDGATDYFSAKYTMWNLTPSGRFSDRFRFETYRSGHMMYLRTEDLRAANQDLRAFIRTAIPAPGEPARYDRRARPSRSSEE